MTKKWLKESSSVFKPIYETKPSFVSSIIRPKPKHKASQSGIDVSSKPDHRRSATMQAAGATNIEMVQIDSDRKILA